MGVAVECCLMNGAQWVAACFFSLPLVPGRHVRRSGRYRNEMQGVLAFEQSCQPYVCLIGDGIWVR